MNLLRFYPAFDDVRQKLQSHMFKVNDVTRLLMRIRNVVHTTTRHRLMLASGLVLDGPMHGKNGQGNTEILFALQGSSVLCAKIGSSRILSPEFKVAQLLQRQLCRAVMCPISLEEIPSTDMPDRVALVMPAYPMSVADAGLAFSSKLNHPRNLFAFNVAVCGLSAVQAFANVGRAHGDIKPGNLMLSSDASGIIVCIDFGTSQEVGVYFEESSIYNLNQNRLAGIDYDLICLGATIATIQHPDIIIGFNSTVEDVLAALCLQSDRPPASKIAEFCLDRIPLHTSAFIKEYIGQSYEIISSGIRLESVWPALIDEP